MRGLAKRLSRVEMQLGECTIHGEPVLCCRCADLKALSSDEAGALGALCLRISRHFTPGPPQPPCPRCHGVRLCARCNGVNGLTAAELTRCTELMAKLMVRRKRCDPWRT
jgi:hypothetical protein